MIYVKPVLPHGWGGITAIYHCVVIHSALELGGYGGKVTIYLRYDKGNREIFLREVGDANVKTIDCSNKIMSQCLNVSMSQ